MTTEKTEERKNRFTGQSIMLTKDEAIKHDRIFINELSATIEDKELGYGGSKLWDPFYIWVGGPVDNKHSSKNK